MATTDINKCAIVIMQGRLGRWASGVHCVSRHLQTHSRFCGIMARSELSPSDQSGVLAQPMGCAGFKICTIINAFRIRGGIPMKKLFMAVLTFILVSFSAVGLAARYDTCALLIADADMKTEGAVTK